MAKKIIPIYSYIGDGMADRVASAISDAERFGDDIEVRISTDGGSVEQGWTILSLIDSFQGNKTLRVDGKAHSMGAFMCLYSDKVEALNVSQFMIHRASYGEWFERSEYFTEALKKHLDQINTSMKAKMKAKLNADAFKTALGVSIDDVFKGEQKDYFFDAKTAKKIGLISSIKELDSVAKSDINAICNQVGIAAFYDSEASATVDASEQPTKELINSNNMTIDQLKKEHPEVVDALRKEVTKEVTANVTAWASFLSIDAKTAQDGMLTGVAPTQAEIAVMQANAIKASLNPATEEAPETPETPEVPAAGAESTATATPSVNAKVVDPRLAELDAMFESSK